MDFFLFLLVNFTLFLRPSEIIPALAEVPIYNILIVLALVPAAPRLAQCLRPDRLTRDPVTVCVVGLIPAVALSQLSHFQLGLAYLAVLDFSKSVVYYLLLIAVVNSAQRLRFFLYAVALFAAAGAAIAVLHYFEFISVPTLTTLQDSDLDEETGEISTVLRLRATGIFGDPNDLSMMAVMGLVISLFGLGDSQLKAFRFAWVMPLALFFLTLILTKSRGGILAFVAAGGTISWLRFGLWKTVAALVVALPLVVLASGSRQSNVGGALSGGTGHARVELWSGGLVALRQSPLFGIGFNMYADEVGQVAHNSFVHGFVELGLFGGALFLGAFWFAGLSLWKLRNTSPSPHRFLADPSFRRMQPYCLAILSGAVLSMFSLSRTYVVPTYLVLGVANAYCLESQRQGIRAPLSITPGRIAALALLSIGFLIVIQIFIKLTLR